MLRKIIPKRFDLLIAPFVKPEADTAITLSAFRLSFRPFNSFNPLHILFFSVYSTFDNRGFPATTDCDINLAGLCWVIRIGNLIVPGDIGTFVPKKLMNSLNLPLELHGFGLWLAGRSGHS
jgi:hypothetical protein